MPHMTDEEWRECMGVATSEVGRDTTYGQAFDAWDEWNPEWVLDKVKANEGFEAHDMLRCFMEAYLQGYAMRVTGGNDANN